MQKIDAEWKTNNCFLSCLKQVSHLKQATSPVSWLLEQVRSSSVGRVAVAPCAVLWDVHEPKASLMGANSLSACRCCSVVGAPVAGIWPSVWVLEVSDLIAVLCSKDFVLYLLYLHIFAEWCLQELGSTSLWRNIKPGSLSGLTPKEFFLTVHNFWGFINIRAF